MASTPAPFIKHLNNEIPTEETTSNSTVNQPSQSESVILHSSTTTLHPVVYKKATEIPKFFHTKPPKN